MLVDYSSIKMFRDLGDDTCPSPSDFDVEPLAVELARRDGFCTDASSGAGPDQGAADSGAGAGSPGPAWGSGAPERARAQWTCSYRPTYNNDWHDDVLCSNGTQQQRPYLREWDSFVTQDEIMQSAREYERQLNGG